MDNELLKLKIAKLETDQDLLNLVNELKIEDLGDKSFPFLYNVITFYKNANKDRRYRVFNIPKKRGGFRRISAPKKGLKLFLTYVNDILSAVYKPKNCVMGFVHNKSILDNASVHLHHRYIFNIDIENFFGQIDRARVRAVLMMKKYGFSKEIASTLAGMCSIKVTDGDSVKYVLPQGAPTSPILANMVCERLDKRLMGLAIDLGLSYTRYADDITFSSNHDVYQADGTFMNRLELILNDEHFTINKSKTRLQKHGSRQEVTGLIVGEKANVARSYIHDIRCIIHIWEKYGYVAAYSKFYPIYKNNKGYVKKGEPLLENVIYGKLMYLKMIKGEGDSTFKRLKSRFDQLCSYPKIEIKNKGLSDFKTLISFAVPDFEANFETEILIDYENIGVKPAFAYLSGYKCPIFFSRKLKKAFLVNNGQFTKCDEESDILRKIVRDKNKLYVSLCETLDGRFWLITEHRPNLILADSKRWTIDSIIKLWKNKGLEFAADKYLTLFGDSIVESEQLESFIKSWSKGCLKDI